MSDGYNNQTNFGNCAITTEIAAQVERPEVRTERVVTVVVTLYNYSQFICECLESVFAQTYSEIELIVVDDCSTADDSLVVAKQWLIAHADRFARVLLLRHRRNQGLAASRNTGFAQAHGDAVFVMDADNAIYPRAMARLYEALIDTGVAAVYSQLEFFGSERRLGHADIWLPQRFQSSNYIDAMALVSKAAWRSVGGYSHLEGGWEDYDFWCKFAERGLEALYVPEILCRYRVHPNSMLRTESQLLHKEMVVELSLRHPWLKLD